MKKKICILLLIIAAICSTSIIAYAAFSSGYVYEKNIEMPQEIKSLITGG